LGILSKFDSFAVTQEKEIPLNLNTESFYLNEVSVDAIVPIREEPDVTPFSTSIFQKKEKVAQNQQLAGLDSPKAKHSGVVQFGNSEANSSVIRQSPSR
jgi:hypothetical protein